MVVCEICRKEIEEDIKLLCPECFASIKTLAREVKKWKTGAENWERKYRRAAKWQDDLIEVLREMGILTKVLKRLHERYKHA